VVVTPSTSGVLVGTRVVGMDVVVGAAVVVVGAASVVVSA